MACRLTRRDIIVTGFGCPGQGIRCIVGAIAIRGQTTLSGSLIVLIGRSVTAVRACTRCDGTMSRAVGVSHISGEISVMRWMKQGGFGVYLRVYKPTL